MRKLITQYLNFQQDGFTLLELLVAISISVLIAGGGFFSFIEYSRSQALHQAVNDVQFAYVQARNNAISNVKPGNGTCNTSSTLLGYQVVLGQDSGGSYYTVELVCLNGGITETAGEKQYLPSDVKMKGVTGTLAACSGVKYTVINGNVSPAVPETQIPCTFEIYHDADAQNLKQLITIENDGMVTLQ